MFRVLCKGARFAVFAYEQQEAYKNSRAIRFHVNGKLYMETDRVVFTIDTLKPKTRYKIEAIFAGQIMDTLELDTNYESLTLDVKDFQAKGDGITDDTLFIQAAIMACPKNGRVLIGQGRYKITSLFLKSDISIELAEGAVLSADTVFQNFPVLPGYQETYEGEDFYTFGSWEGNPLDSYASILTGINVSNVNIYGRGKIDGNSTVANWWDPKIKHIEPFRPRTIFLNDCKNIHISGISIYNSPSWTIHPYRSENVNVLAIDIFNPSDSPNTDGIDAESCNNLKIMGVFFDLGDDCIAIKSGKIFMANKKYLPSQNIDIEHCHMKNGHGAVTIGSEIASGCENIVVKNCIFEHTDRGLRVKTRRGRGNKSVIDKIYFENIIMKEVKTGFVINSFYFCDPDGKSDYVQNQEIMAKDERTPTIGYIEFKNIQAKGCKICAAYIHGLPENPIKEIVFEKIFIEFANSDEWDYPAMMLGIDKMNRNHAVFKNIDKLILKDFQVIHARNEMTKEAISEMQYQSEERITL